MALAGFGEHIHQRFDRELESLRNRVVEMGGLVECQITDALTALRKADPELAGYVIRTDHRVNAHEVGIDEDCTGILARRQPAAGDLRMVMAIIKTITDLERIGDESEKIARIVRAAQLSSLPELAPVLQDIDTMGDRVVRMLHDALDAFVRLDAEAAIATGRLDRDIDAHYVALLTGLIRRMKCHPDNVEVCQSLIWVVRALERIGDHTRNCCEYIVYLVEGRDVRHTTIEDRETKSAC